MTSSILTKLERLLEQRNKLNGKPDTSNILESLSFAMMCSVFLTPPRIRALIDVVKALEALLESRTDLKRDATNEVWKGFHDASKTAESAINNLNSQFQ